MNTHTLISSSSFPSRQSFSHVLRSAACALALGLVACGGSDETVDGLDASATGDAVVSESPPSETAQAGVSAGANTPTASTATPVAAEASDIPTASATPANAPTASGAAAKASGSTCDLAGFQADLLQELNAARAVARSCGGVAYSAAAPLVWNARLTSAATRHSTDMADNDLFSHTGSDDSESSQRATEAGYGWSAIGENIAAGYPDVRAVVDGWLESPEHCKNIMNGDYADLGAACASQVSSSYGKYWTMVVAKP